MRWEDWSEMRELMWDGKKAQYGAMVISTLCCISYVYHNKNEDRYRNNSKDEKYPDGWNKE